MRDRFDKIYFSTYHQLYLFIQRNISDKSAIKDALQECYVRLWENMEEVYDDERVLGLLKTYAIRLILNDLRKRKNELVRNHRYHLSVPETQDPKTGLEARELMDRYRNALDVFPPQRKKVFLLKREHGLTHKEISERLGISVYTIDRHMNAALKVLRETLTVEKLILVGVLLEIDKIPLI